MPIHHQRVFHHHIGNRFNHPKNNFTTSDSSLSFFMQNCCWTWIQCHIYQLMMFVESGIWRTDNLPHSLCIK
jgi:hypothetical protein